MPVGFNEQDVVREVSKVTPYLMIWGYFHIAAIAYF
jgi:hypothetical protein